jgi:hypothetical protein
LTFAGCELRAGVEYFAALDPYNCLLAAIFDRLGPTLKAGGGLMALEDGTDEELAVEWTSYIDEVSC